MLIKDKSACNLQGLQVGTLYHLFSIYREHFKDGDVGRYILNRYPSEYPMPCVYVTKDDFNYYFKSATNIGNELDRQYIIAGSPYKLAMSDCDVIVPAIRMCGAKFVQRGHNGWFDVYEYSKGCYLLPEEDMNKLVVVGKDIYHVLPGIEYVTYRFDTSFIKSHSTLRIMCVPKGSCIDYDMKNVEVNEECLVIYDNSNSKNIICTIMPQLVKKNCTYSGNGVLTLVDEDGSL